MDWLAAYVNGEWLSNGTRWQFGVAAGPSWHHASMSSPVSLRARKMARTRRTLMEVALSLFEQQGYDATTVEEITAAAEVAPRTFFRYFPSKVDVLFADQEEVLAIVREDVTVREPHETIIQAVRRAMHTTLDHVLADPDLNLRRGRLTADTPTAHARFRQLDADYEQIIAEAVAADSGTDPELDLRARVIARAACGAMRAAGEVWLASDGALDPRRLIDDAFDLIEAGLR